MTVSSHASSRLRGRRKVYAVPSSSNQSSGEPEVPPDVPPEYADAYLAGFRRGLGGLEPEAPAPPAQQDPPPEAPGPVHQPEPVQPSSPVASDEATLAAEEEPESPERLQPAESERGGTDLEWLFDRRETGPQGWSERAGQEDVGDSTNEPRRKPEPDATASGATSVAGQGPKSPWPLLGAFLVVLLLLMLLAYLGGMAFSTIMDR